MVEPTCLAGVDTCVDVPVYVNGVPTGAVTQQCTEVCGDVAFPGNPTGKKWAPWDDETANLINDLTFFAHINEIYPYTPEMCQQLCEQARTGGIKNVGNSFSTTGDNMIEQPLFTTTGTTKYYQCLCGVTDGNCVINTLLPDKDSWQTRIRKNTCNLI